MHHVSLAVLSRNLPDATFVVAIPQRFVAGEFRLREKTGKTLVFEAFGNFEPVKSTLNLEADVHVS